MPDSAANPSMRESFSSKLVRAVVPGVRTSIAQIEPWARYWTDQNDQVINAPTARAPWWAALGDSTAQGIGAEHPGFSWVGQLQRQADRRDGHGAVHAVFDLPVLNFSLSGARVADVIDTQLGQLRAAIARLGPPSVVAVAVGGNDVVRSVRLGPSIAALHRLAAQLPRGSVLATLPAPRSSVIGQQWNRAVAAAAVEHGHRVAPVHERHRPLRPSLLANDRFHPNRRGYALWADAFSSALVDDDAVDHHVLDGPVSAAGAG